LRTEAENTRAQESVRKADIAKAVEAANIECQVSEHMHDVHVYPLLLCVVFVLNALYMILPI